MYIYLCQNLWVPINIPIYRPSPSLFALPPRLKGTSGKRQIKTFLPRNVSLTETLFRFFK